MLQKTSIYFIVLFAITLYSANCNLLFAQTWEADLTKIGQSKAGGFDYQWKNFTSEEVGTHTYTWDYAGTRILKHAPAAGIHPRIFFNPEDTTEIRTRLTTTINGIEVNRKRHAFTTLLHLGYTGGTYSSNGSYAKNSSGLAYIGNSGYWDFKPIYYKFAAGDTSAYSMVKLKNGGALNPFANMLSMEAFECLLFKNNYDPDTKLNYNTRAVLLAKALTTFAFAASCNGLTSATYDRVGGMAFPIAYDLAYPFMTSGQRDTVRAAVAMIVPTTPRYGFTTEPYATTSNWAGLNCFEIIPNLAIEGETGYNAAFTHKWMTAFYKFVTYGFYDSGCGWEGLGKNYMITAYQIAFARRGYGLLGHPHVRAFGNHYLPALAQPFGYSFTGDDALGGSGTNVQLGKYKFQIFDAVGQKWAYPNDTAVDFMWRNYAGNMVKGLEIADFSTGNMDPGTQAYHDPMAALQAYVTDFATTDYSTHAQAALKNLDFMETDRGQVILRSDWSTNALQTIFNVRQNFGGHTNADRNSFTLSSHGRIWVPLRSAPGGAYYDVTEAHSCVLVDNLGIKITNLEGNKARQPGKLVRWSSGNTLSQAVGDATYAYSWEFYWSAQAAGKDNPNLGKTDPGKQPWIKATETLNDFRATPSSESFYNIPFYEFAAWNSPAGYRETIIKRPYNPMEKVYRTMNMVRGKHPFVLVVDDVKKDAQTHNYKWTMQLATDIVVESTSDKGNGMYDVVLKENAGTRRLLVRMLQQNDYQTGTPPARLDTTWYVTGDGKSYKGYRLVCESNAVSPDFKVLLYPHASGEQLPATSWNPSKTTLDIRWNDEQKSLGFSQSGGFTNVSLLVTGLETNSVNQNLLIAPNPATNSVVLKNVANTTVSIYDMTGRELIKKKCTENETIINISGLSTTCYLVKAVDGTFEKNAKMLINR